MAKAAGKPAGTTTIPTVAVLHGPDRFTQLERTEAVKQAIATQHGAVEPVLFDGASAAPAVILDECRSLSLMQSFKLIIVDNADELL
ncbi:MAG: hypothetical protein ACT4PL_11045, partial [Phycisphaerales bacterium]